MRSGPGWSAPIEPTLSSRPDGLVGWIARGTLLLASVVVIVLREEQPGRGCVVQSSLTFPVDLAKLPMDAAPVSFQSEFVTRDCE
jgi:hypothetical protein